jgi:hypothetical protein
MREEENSDHASLFILWQTTRATEGLNHNITAAKKIWTGVKVNEFTKTEKRYKNG